MKQRRLNTDRTAGGAFTRFCQAVSFLENEAALPAGSADDYEVPVAFTQGALEMVEVIAHIPFGYFDDAGEFFCRIRAFFKKGCNIVADRLVSLGGIRPVHGLEFSILFRAPHRSFFVSLRPVVVIPDFSSEHKRYMGYTVGLPGYLKPELFYD